jgi:hypothetical protein
LYDTINLEIAITYIQNLIVLLIESGGGNRPCEARQPTNDNHLKRCYILQIHLNLKNKRRIC